jgi:hypothetical protein
MTRRVSGRKKCKKGLRFIDANNAVSGNECICTCFNRGFRCQLRIELITFCS